MNMRFSTQAANADFLGEDTPDAAEAWRPTARRAIAQAREAATARPNASPRPRTGR